MSWIPPRPEVQPDTRPHGDKLVREALTVRDAFAMVALHVWLMSDERSAQAVKLGAELGVGTQVAAALAAYSMADAMLQARDIKIED